MGKIFIFNHFNKFDIDVYIKYRTRSNKNTTSKWLEYTFNKWFKKFFKKHNKRLKNI